LDGSEDVIAAFGPDERLWIGVSGFDISTGRFGFGDGLERAASDDAVGEEREDAAARRCEGYEGFAMKDFDSSDPFSFLDGRKGSERQLGVSYQRGLYSSPSRRAANLNPRAFSRFPPVHRTNQEGLLRVQPV
jgi:hypothetical protein